MKLIRFGIATAAFWLGAVQSNAVEVVLPSDQELLEQAMRLKGMPSEQALDAAQAAAKGRIERDIGTPPAKSPELDVPAAAGSVINAPAEKGNSASIAAGAGKGTALERAAASVSRYNYQAIPKPQNANQANLAKLAEQLERGIKTDAKKPDNSDFMVFVSFSMPEQRLKEVIRQVGELGGVAVLRGTVDGQISTVGTVTRLQKLGLERLPVHINPDLYTRFQIDSVPTYVVADSSAHNIPSDDGACSPAYSFSAITGDISAAMALGLIKERTSQPELAKIAKKYLVRGKSE